MNLSRWSNPQALDNLAKALESRVIIPPQVEITQRPMIQLPRYEYQRPWLERMFGTGCASCGSGGWLQKQITQPKRIVRFLVWLTALVPRSYSLARTILSKRVRPDEFMTRMKTCFDHSFGPQACAVHLLRLKKGKVHEELHCGKCNCPRTPWASLHFKNHKAGWRCPAGLHVGSDRDAAYKAYVQVELASSTPNATIKSGDGHGD